MIIVASLIGTHLYVDFFSPIFHKKILEVVISDQRLFFIGIFFFFFQMLIVNLKFFLSLGHTQAAFFLESKLSDEDIACLHKLAGILVIKGYL